jgi:hypothetical protein
MFQNNKWKDAEKVLVFSDFHSGAIDSIKRDSVLNSSHLECAIPIGTSKLHKYMDYKFREVEEEHRDANYILFLGDMVNGADSKSDGIDCWTTDLDLQSLNVAELFYPFEDAVCYGVNGSGYHSRTNPSQDKKVLDILGGYFNSKEYSVELCGVNFHMRHFAGYTKNKPTRASTLGKDLLDAEVNSGVYGNIDVYLRGHCHYLVYLGWAVPDKLAVICPGYKGRDIFIAHRGLDIPQCGHLIFEVVDGQYRWSPHVWELPKEMLIPQAPKVPKERPELRRERIKQLRIAVNSKKQVIA